jgi:tRNA-dihydrouridine synthase A
VKEEDYNFSVAPMMDWTDRHCRYFHRILSARARLYTEMVTAAAIIHGDRQRLLGFHPAEHPVALQVGGSDPAELARAAEIAAPFGYDEINLNCGCPSDRVQAGRFGACLMAEPELVAECVKALASGIGGAVPVTVKCRIGIDDQDSEAALDRFVGTVAEAGCQIFIVHARKAWLSGLSPKENREIPPLNYDRVYRLRQKYPELTIVINGGIANLDEAATHLCHVHGVMLGRAAYKNPALLTEVDHRIFGEPHRAFDLATVLMAMRAYAQEAIAGGARVSSVTRHMTGLMNGFRGARAFRRLMTEESVKPGAGLEIFDRAVDMMSAQDTHRQEAA